MCLRYHSMSHCLATNKQGDPNMNHIQPGTTNSQRWQFNLKFSHLLPIKLMQPLWTGM